MSKKIVYSIAQMKAFQTTIDDVSLVVVNDDMVAETIIFSSAPTPCKFVPTTEAMIARALLDLNLKIVGAIGHADPSGEMVMLAGIDEPVVNTLLEKSKTIPILTSDALTPIIHHHLRQKYGMYLEFEKPEREFMASDLIFSCPNRQDVYLTFPEDIDKTAFMLNEVVSEPVTFSYLSTPVSLVDDSVYPDLSKSHLSEFIRECISAIIDVHQKEDENAN